jgi:hypothetical protein
MFISDLIIKLRFEQFNVIFCWFLTPSLQYLVLEFADTWPWMSLKSPWVWLFLTCTNPATNTCTEQPIFYFIHLGISEVPDLKLKDVLKFIAGCETIPPIGFPCNLNVHFRHGCPDKCKCRPTCFGANTAHSFMLFPGTWWFTYLISDWLLWLWKSIDTVL